MNVSLGAQFKRAALLGALCIGALTSAHAETLGWTGGFAPGDSTTANRVTSWSEAWRLTWASAYRQCKIRFPATRSVEMTSFSSTLRRPDDRPGRWYLFSVWKCRSTP
jgi:hypothetical protein